MTKSEGKPKIWCRKNPDRLTYTTFHVWLKKYHGKPDHCEFCTKPAKRFEWALLKGKVHEKNVNNYIQLCPSCHRKYDATEEQRIKQKESWYKIDRPKRGNHRSAKKVVSILPNGNMEYFDCILDAYDKYGFKHTNISMCLTGKNATAYGRKWKYV
jgi:hypothetical protein